MMGLIRAVLQLYLTLILLLQSTRATISWETYKTKYNLQFKESEEEYRKQVFHQNLEEIQKLRESGSKDESFTVAVNPLAHRTLGERASIRGIILPEGIQPIKPKSRPKLTLPGSVDYRASSCMPPIKNQLYCSSCWAFVATTPVEYYYCNKTGKLERLSEQQLVDCSTENSGCHEGFYTTAWDYIHKTNGLCREFTYPYLSGVTRTEGKCRRSTCTTSAFLRSYRLIESDATAMADIVANVGPIAVALSVDSLAFFFYQGGVYREPNCSTNVNHGLVIVGFGTTPDGIDYWIARNSWGKDWGEGGYIRIERGTNTCGIENYPAYPIV